LDFVLPGCEKLNWDNKMEKKEGCLSHMEGLTLEYKFSVSKKELTGNKCYRRS
jgi:hypothetical protein